MMKGRVRGLGLLAIGLGSIALQACKMPRGVPATPPLNAPPCPANRPPLQYKFTGWPPHGLMLNDETYGAVASWTAEGLPPAGDRCSFPPPGITARAPGNEPGK